MNKRQLIKLLSKILEETENGYRIKTSTRNEIKKYLECSNSIDSPVDGQRKKSSTESDSDGTHLLNKMKNLLNGINGLIMLPDPFFTGYIIMEFPVDEIKEMLRENENKKTLEKLKDQPHDR